MNYNLFRAGLVGDFLDKVNQEEPIFIKLYDNQEKFLYPFKEIDILESNIKVVNENLGEVLLETFYKLKEDQQVADFECAKILYENLKLTPAQAGNADFWNYLHHFDMYKYIHKRWKNQGNMQTHIKRHWLMNLTSQKHLINFPLTTLWWSIHLTVDKSRDDIYELSKVYFSNNRFRTVSLGGMSFVRHKEALLSVLEFMKIHRDELTQNITYTELGNDISKFINLLGGTKPLSFFDRDWFTEKLEKRFAIKTKEEEKNFLLEENKKLRLELAKTKAISLKKVLLDNEEQVKIKTYFDNLFESIKGFGALETRTLAKKFKNASFSEIKFLCTLIENHFAINNIEDKRSIEAYNLLKKKLLKKSITFFDDDTSSFSDVVPNSDKTNIDEVKGVVEFKEKQNTLCYFCLNNGDNPNYMLSDSKRENFDYCIEINEVNKNGYLLHFYSEGKIKKTKIDSYLLGKTRNHMYSNGKCNNLNLVGLKIITNDFLFGIAYSKNGVIKFKAMDGSDSSLFRIDNNALNQEGKKILYVQDYDLIKYKLLPYSIKENLGTLLQGPLGKGSDILNNYHLVKWQTLEKFWPELFANQQGTLGFND